SDRARRGCGLAALAHGRGGRRPREMELCRRAAIVLAAIMLIPGLAAASPTLDRIASRGRMGMAVDAAYPPLSFLKDDQLQGFDIDVGREVARRLGVTLETVTPGWDIITAGHWNRRWDICIGSMAPTKTRAEVLDFPAVYYYAPAVLIVHKDNTWAAKPRDLSSRRIGVQAASTYERYLDKELVISVPGVAPLTFQIDNAKAVPYASDPAAFQDLALGDGVRLDGVLSSYLAATQQIKQGGPFRIVGKPLFEEPLAVAIDKGDADFGKKIAAIIDAMRADGTLRRLSIKW